MSSDESMSESDESSAEMQSDDECGVPKPKVLVVKKLTWRSRELNELMAKLDKKIARKRSQKGQSMLIKRKVGPPSTRMAPMDAPKWAICS